jgi:hypothetical protein
MQRLIFLFVVGALALALPPLAQAMPKSGGARAPAPGTINLQPLVVHGHHFPLPIILQTIKTGLKLPWTNDINDTRIRCRFETDVGTHIGKTLWCETNRHHIMRTNSLQTALESGNAMHPTGGGRQLLPAAAGNALNGMLGAHSVRPAALKHLLSKLPSTDSSYTLRITDHGKPEVAYVVKDGELVKVIRYAKKKPSGH